MKLITTVLLTIVLCTQGFAQEYIGSKQDIDQILQNVKSFSKHVMNADFEMIGASYTDDAKIFPNNTLIIAGKEDIINYWTHPEDVSIVYHEIIPSEIKVNGDEAYDYGYYKGRTKRPDGQKVSWEGKYVIVWRKVNGQWKIYLDIWNSTGKK